MSCVQAYSVPLLCLSLCYPTDCSPPCSSVHGIFHARILEWVTISYCIGHVYVESFWKAKIMQISSVQFSHSVVSDSLWPHEPPHARPPCPSPTPGVHPCPHPLSWWCNPTISFSVVPFSCPQSFPASESFQMSQFFASGGQSIGASASTSALPMNTQDWSPLGWTDWISF